MYMKFNTCVVQSFIVAHAKFRLKRTAIFEVISRFTTNRKCARGDNFELAGFGCGLFPPKVFYVYV